MSVRYQQLKPFKRGDVWVVRWREGNRRPQRILGMVKDLPTMASAQRAADDLRREVNAGKPMATGSHLFGALIDLYIREEMPKRYSTSKAYRSNIKNHVRPKWENEPIERLAQKPLEIRKWLEGLELSPKSKAHVKSLMISLFETAMLHGLIPQAPNPMDLIHVKGVKRKQRPATLSSEELKPIRERLERPFDLIALMAQCYGPRASEILGFQWQDFDFKRLEFQIRRGVVDGRVGEVKTEYSNKWLPLDEEVAAELLKWRAETQFSKDTDWVFASPFLAGEMPYSYTCTLEKLKKAGGTGWHIFRHTYRVLVDSTGAPIGVQKDMMRHSDIRTTMNYGDTQTRDMRQFSRKVVQMVLRPKLKLDARLDATGSK